MGLSPSQIAGVILAGGESRRMGRADKAGLILGGKSLLQRAADRLAPQVTALAVSAHVHMDLADALGLTILRDAAAERQGPLAGILAGLSWGTTVEGVAAIVTVPVDTPFFPRDLVDALARAGGDGRTIAVARSGSGLHPTVALFAIGLRDALAERLATSGDRSVRGFIAAHGTAAVDFPDTGAGDPFFNINTPDDLRRAEALLARGPRS